MRDLQPSDLGVLLSVFAVLLIFFGIEFRISRRSARRHRGRALLYAAMSLVGEAATAIALVLTWVSLFLPPEAKGVDTVLVFAPGSVAVLCAVVLTVESVTERFVALSSTKRDARDG